MQLYFYSLGEITVMAWKVTSNRASEIATDRKQRKRYLAMDRLPHASYVRNEHHRELLEHVFCPLRTTGSEFSDAISNRMVPFSPCRLLDLVGAYVG